MKQVIIFCLLLTGICDSVEGQIDSNFRFRKANLTFQDAMTKAIEDAETANPYDTAEGGHLLARMFRRVIRV